MPLLRTLSLVLAAASLAGPAIAAGPPTLSDAALAALAHKPFDKQTVMNRTVVLGRHHGIIVVADYPCSDLCPAYTIRIIHYDVEPGPACAAAGGVTESRIVPEGISEGDEPFCIPKVLAGRSK